MGRKTRRACFACYIFFFADRQRIIKADGNFFTDGGDGDSRTNESREFSKKWGWFAAAADLAGGDLLKIDSILQKNIIEVFNFLAYLADKKTVEKAEEEQRKRQQQQKQWAIK